MPLNEDGPDNKLLTVITGLAMTEINALQAELAEARAEIARLRHELGILAGRAWNLAHTEPKKDCALCKGVEQALAVLKPDAGKDTP